MRILIALVILVTLALLGSSKRFWVWRRSRLGAALTTGGWLFVLIGFLLGEHGAGLARPEQMLAVRPLIHFLLGLVGLMVGLQLDRRLPMALPAPVRWVTIFDWSASIVVFAAVALGVFALTGQASWGAGAVAGLLGVVGVGWAADVRSLRHEGAGGEQLSKMIRAVSGLGGILAVIAYGLMFKSFAMDPTGRVVGWALAQTVVGVGVSLAIGLGMGLMGKWLTGVAGRGVSEFLVVMLGLTALLAGAAATMGYSPMFVALWAGALMCNLPGKSLEPMKRVIIEAEQPVATALMLVAGVMLDPRIGVTGLALIGALVAARAMLKAAVGRWGVIPTLPAAPRRGALSVMVRQSPLAIALAAGYAVSAYGLEGSGTPLTGGQVVTVVVAVGLTAEMWALMRTPRDPSVAAPSRPNGSGPAAPAEATQP